MKVIMLNGSPHTNGNTALALREMAEVFEAEDIKSEIIPVGNQDVHGCTACYACAKLGKCVFDDIVNKIASKFRRASGLVVASPVYYAGANATLCAVLDRLFFSTCFDKAMKVGASVAVGRRGGHTSVFDQLNKYFFISGMPVAAGQYWNCVYGQKPGEVLQDEEGMQSLRTLAHNMAFLIKAIELGKDVYGVPEREEFIATNFVR